MRTFPLLTVLAAAMFFAAGGTASAQTVQAGISAAGTVLTVSAMPSSAITGNYSAGNISIRWETSYNVTLGAITTANGTWVLDAENQTSGQYTFNTYTFVAGSAIPINWTGGNTYELFSVPVNQTGSGTGTFELTESEFTAAAGWYFELGGNDLTDYVMNYYVGSVQVALPVELASFVASAKGSTVELAWTTASETDVRSFEIERAAGGAWKPVATVDAAGSSNAPKEYTYVDKVTFAANGAVSYRLKMVDNDGSFRYSTVAEASVAPTVFALEQNFPNPFNPATTIRYSLPSAAVVNLTVYDMLGRVVTNVVNETQAPGYYERRFGGIGLASGMYVYRLTAESNGTMLFTAVKKMLLTK